MTAANSPGGAGLAEGHGGATVGIGAGAAGRSGLGQFGGLPDPVELIGAEAELQAAIAETTSLNLPVPQPKQLGYQEAERGMIFHYDVSIFHPPALWVKNNSYRGEHDPSLFNPPSLDTDQWMRVAKESGARFVVLTATHRTGFMNWASDLYPFGMKQAAWKGGKGDLVADFVEAAHRAALKPGIYLSTKFNNYLGVWDDVAGGKPQSPFEADGKTLRSEQAAYNELAVKMVDELTSRYGPLFELWFDAGVLEPSLGGPDVLPTFDKNQPGALFYKNGQRRDYRWARRADKGIAELPCWSRINGPNFKLHKPDMLHGDVEGAYWSSAYLGFPLTDQWFYVPGQGEADGQLQEPVETLLAIHNGSVGHNCTSVFGATPKPDGLIPEWQASVLREFGHTIRKWYDSPIKQAKAVGRSIKLILDQPAVADHAIVQEDLRYGERIRKWQIRGKTPAGWADLGSGESIGNKRIVLFEPVELAELEFRVDAAVATPIFRRIAVGNRGT